MKIFLKSKLLFTFVFIIFFQIPPKNASELLPSGLIFNDYPGSTVLVIDKSICRLMIYKFKNSWKFETIKHAMGLTTPVMRDCIPQNEIWKCRLNFSNI